ncbi:MAG: NAD(P)-binding domain-containing protein [Bacteroidales bacterium]|nr:NAD(P)-binding domain-containing protein [Bacteroidales bacterium]
MKKSIGFIGGGRITRIILQAFRNKGFAPENVVVSDTNPEVIGKLRTLFPFILEGTPEETAKQEILFIALHPPAIMETLDNIKEIISPDAIVISLAPKITIEKISGKLNELKNVARLIPNATSVINEGYNSVTFSSGFRNKEEILELMMLLGDTFETEESKLEAYAIISAMLPTYFWFQWQACVKIGEQTGLSPEESRVAVVKTLGKAIQTQFGSGFSYEEVIDLIPVKPIGEHEAQIREIFSEKLIGLFKKIQP